MSVQDNSISLKISAETTETEPARGRNIRHKLISKSCKGQETTAAAPRALASERAKPAHYGVNILRISEAPMKYSSHHARSGDIGRCYFLLLLHGDVSFQQDDIVIRLGPGEMFLTNPERPYTLTLHEPSELLTFAIPCGDIRSRLGDLKRYTGVKTSTADPICDIVATMMRKVATALSFPSAFAEPRTMEAVINLAAMALGRSAHASPDISSCGDIVRDRLERAIAREVGVSVRYVNKVLAERGTSLMRHVKDTRLEHCARVLEDPSQHQRSITEIAMSLGFNDMSHFSRAFRERFEMSPREFRARTP